MKPIRMIISGGGTGGHIFPAIAIANAVKALRPDTEILFVGALGKMEMEKVPQAGYRIEGLPIAGIQRRLTVKNLLLPFRIIQSMIKARTIIRSFRPDIAVGVGGYASGPLLRAAASAGVPTLLQEQNSYPGITNKILAKTARKICVAYEGLGQWFPKDKLILTGNPVRKAVCEINGKRERAVT
ncbi:MAG: UDP-N-acetylglucosamine--N-acetylmuramyl-(pentapeptide) pyrophosphoryl-undecaprenol N-acetylglucosamine transferase, partial [Flavobacteriales bacterium]